MDTELRLSVDGETHRLVTDTRTTLLDLRKCSVMAWEGMATARPC